MLKFRVFDDNGEAHKWAIRNAYLVGSDKNAVRGWISFQDGLIICEKREPGVAALALQQNVGDCGELTLQTCFLPEHDEPYLLTLELARHRLMLLYNKLEDWAMFDLADDHPVTERANFARKAFIEALCLARDDPRKADQLARRSLDKAIDATEELALAHAAVMLNRRRTAGMVPKYPMGCGISLDQTNDRLRQGMAANFDFLQMPTPWKVVAPEEGDFRFAQLDSWVEWASRNRTPIIAGPLVCFSPDVLPDWLYIWEHDYETVRDIIYEHIERLVTRYRNNVAAWTVVSGLHVNSHFTFKFEQLLDLTRMGVMLVKKIQPRAKVLIEIRQPFGEYFGSNQRSIPPLMYADALVQSAISFDGLTVKLMMGQATPGLYTRDLMQASNLLDEFAFIGKPLTVVLGAPSEPVTQEMISVPEFSEQVDDRSGSWRKPWSPTVQSHWLQAFMQMVMSKPYVEAVVWQDIVDHRAMELPMSGLVTEDLHPKSAYRKLAQFRRGLLGLDGADVEAPVSNLPSGKEEA
jgi:hypothetical protein